MTDGIAVTDSSPLIILHQIYRLELLRSLFRAVVAPPAVAREIVPSLGALPTWIREHHSPTTPDLAMSLHAGEREAIALALHGSPVDTVRPDLDAMVANGLYVSPRLYHEILAAAGESGVWRDNC